ncbi:hypothetical protein D3C87_1762420 [compost metagenome]
MVIALQRDGAAAERGQLLDAEDQHRVVLPGQQRVPCQVHAGGAAGAGVLDVVDRDALEPQIAHDQLAEDHAAQDVGAVDRLDAAGRHVGIGQRLQDCLLRQLRRQHGGVPAERRHRAAMDVDVLHLAYLSFSRSIRP